MKCGCKRNLLGICSCKRVSRGRGRKTRRAITDEPYERAVRPRYAVPRSRRPEYNFPAIDPKRPGQVLRPGVPSVSTGFTAPSPFSRGATSAFGPVLQAASNYINEITRTARLQNQMTMSNMGGGGSAGSRSNIVVNGSTDSRNTQSVLSRNPNSVPINENVNAISSDGTYQSWRNNVIVADQDLFDYNANLGTQNLNVSLPQNQPQQNLDSSVDNDENSSVQVLADNDQYNRNFDNLINEQMIQQEDNEPFDNVTELNDNDKYVMQRIINADSPARQRFLNQLEKVGELETFEKGLEMYRQQNRPSPNMSNVDPTFRQNIEKFLDLKQEPNVTPPRSKTDASSSNFGPNDKVTFSSGGSSMYPSGVVEVNSNYKLQNPDPNSLNNLMNTGFASPVFGNANSSSSSSSASNIGSKSTSSRLRKFVSPLGNQDIPKMKNILPEDDVTESMTPSEYDDESFGSKTLSGNSSTRESQDAKIARQADISKARQDGIGVQTRGGGKRIAESVSTPSTMSEMSDADAILMARMLAGQGYKSEQVQKQMQKEASEQPTNKITVENVFAPQVKKKKK
jgi:hypothetical protein